MTSIDKDSLFTAVIADDAGWQDWVNEVWGCLNQDDRRRIRVLATGRGTGGGGGSGDPGTDVRRSFNPLDVDTSSDHVLVTNTVLGNGAAITESFPYIVWNGRIYEVADGSRDSAPFYLSTDSGATALAFTSFTSLANLYFNALTAAEPMVSTDKLLIVYRK